LISVAHTEASYRNLNIPKSHLNEDLPTIKIKGGDFVKIKDQKYLIAAYQNETSDWIELEKDEIVEFDFEKIEWLKLKKEDKPIQIRLDGEEENKTIEFHSRSKIFWFNKLLETESKEDFVDFKFDKITFDD
jgi:RNA recognition motif-containing protein